MVKCMLLSLEYETIEFNNIDLYGQEILPKFPTLIIIIFTSLYHYRFYFFLFCEVTPSITVFINIASVQTKHYIRHKRQVLKNLKQYQFETFLTIKIPINYIQCRMKHVRLHLKAEVNVKGNSALLLKQSTNAKCRGRKCQTSFRYGNFEYRECISDIPIKINVLCQSTKILTWHENHSRSFVNFVFICMYVFIFQISRVTERHKPLSFIQSTMCIVYVNQAGLDGVSFILFLNFFISLFFLVGGIQRVIF